MVLAQERLAQWRADYEAVKPKRDALAEELKIYPAAVAKLVDLLGRVAANDAEIGELHRRRPAGISLHLDEAELVARGIERFSRNTPTILRDLQLPDWENSPKLAYPPRQPGVGAAYAASMAPAVQYDRRFSGDWWKDGDARAAEQAAESKRVADFYADQKRQHDEREDAEAARVAQVRR